MNTLRSKITILLVVAILAVVVLATGLSLYLVERPRLESIIDATVSQISLAIEIATQKHLSLDVPDRIDRIGLRESPAAGPLIEEPSRGLTDRLRNRGVPLPVRITKPPELPWIVASIGLTDGRWLIVPIAAPLPPANSAWILGSWMLLIATGTAIAAVAAAYWMIKPLTLFEKAIAEIDADGEIPQLPETGPAEVRSTARTINLLSARLKTAIESRMRLVAAAGHDLRTPLTRMRLRAEFLDEEERRQWLSDLDELDRIADSAIRLVREEVESTSIADIWLDELIEEVAAELKEINLSAVVKHVEPIAVSARPLSFKRALRNLIINAATHGGGAALSVRPEGNMALVLIDDYGPGIPESLLQRVFEPFFRVDPARRAPVPGAGLGLAIAKEIIVGNNGELTLVNRPEGGLRQEIRLQRKFVKPA